MGQKQSLTESDRRRLYRRLQGAEIDLLSRIWRKVCNDGGTALDTGRLTAFLSERGLPQVWSNRIVSLAEQIVNVNSSLPSNNFLSFGAIFISDATECLTELLYVLVEADQTETSSGKRKGSRDFQKNNLTDFLLELFLLYVSVLKNSVEYQRWHFSDSYSAAALVKCVSKDLDATTVLQYKHVHRWLSQTPLVRVIISAIFRFIFKLPGTKERISILPAVYGTARLTSFDPLSSTVIFDALGLAFVSLQLPSDLRGEFRLLYSNKVHGDSFAELVNRITNVGPVLLLVRDENNHVFGGFSRENWLPKAYFFGTSDCFLFSLHPQMNMYPSCNANVNYMFLDTNENSTYTGLGMGGQLGHFGLFINGECTFGYGTSNPSKTYNSPQLSASHHFRINQIEVWSVSNESPGIWHTGSSVDEEKEKKKSILEKDPAGLTLLSLAGKGPYSEGYRQSSSTSDLTTECQRTSVSTMSRSITSWHLAH